MPAISATAPAKTILFGEHAVVYNRPAIAVPIRSLKTKVSILADPLGKSNEVFINAPDIKLYKLLLELPSDHPIATVIKAVINFLNIDHLPACVITVTSKIPIAAGLGSSASTAVALIRALVEFLGVNLTNEKISALAFQIEKIHHGNPSGIDNTVIAFDRPIYFVRDQAIEILKINKSFTLVIGNTGMQSLTKETVADVRENWLAHKDLYEIIFDQIGETVRKARYAFESGDIEEMGELMTLNHSLLQQITVSNPKLDSLVNAALRAGALGAKLCGSGRGGNMIALVKEEKNSAVQEALKSAGAVQTFFTKVYPS